MACCGNILRGPVLIDLTKHPESEASETEYDIKQ
jgi:hypothetical protein